MLYLDSGDIRPQWLTTGEVGGSTRALDITNTAGRASLQRIVQSCRSLQQSEEARIGRSDERTYLVLSQLVGRGRAGIE
jgi:hypothetical protein